MSVSIRVQHLTLEVPTFVQRERETSSWLGTLAGVAAARPRRIFRKLLDDVSFELQEGDRLALIGRNGAGKTTLLRVLTGAFIPTHGKVSIQGTRQALLNVNLGFNQQATLVENVYLRGTAMGITTQRLKPLVHTVLEFAELTDKAQDRLYTLSLGQRMRLGFAVATAMQQDIMLMDEWLGAGDTAFLARAKARMDDQIAGSKILVLASHNAGLIRNVCNKGILLEAGRITFAGSIQETLQHYNSSAKSVAATTEADTGAELLKRAAR